MAVTHFLSGQIETSSLPPVATPLR
jgi:hypothetical protein